MSQQYLGRLSPSQIGKIKRWIRPYLNFRADVEEFQKRHFSEICTQKCFMNRMSACCGRVGIATFFADVVINVLLSTSDEVDTLVKALLEDPGGFSCVYLTPEGCLWRLKPIVCEMFLCKYAQESILERNEPLQTHWNNLRRRERRYTWPSRPVLFNKLEWFFIQAGFDSPLMYFHKSPGLLRVKEQALQKNPK